MKRVFQWKMKRRSDTSSADYHVVLTSFNSWVFFSLSLSCFFMLHALCFSLCFVTLNLPFLSFYFPLSSYFSSSQRWCSLPLLIFLSFCHLTLNDKLTDDVRIHLRHLYASVSICLLCVYSGSCLHMNVWYTQPSVWSVFLVRINISVKG